MSRRRRSRVLALQLMYQFDRAGGPPSAEALSGFWEAQGPPEGGEVRLFAEELFEGVTSCLERIDKVVAAAAEHWDPGRMAVVDRNILRLAAYELLYRDDIPPKVSINEYVDIAKKYSTEESGRFVNGILDRILKEHPRDARGGQAEGG